MRLRTTLYLIASLLATTSAAQDKVTPESDVLPTPAPTKDAIRFEQLSLSDGLSQSSVYDIMQDRNGFIWIATQEGLNRYDGKEFNVFKRAPFDSLSLSFSWVWSIAEAPDGSIWATTNGGGLNRLDPLTGKVTHYRHAPADSTSLSGNNTFRVLVDSRGTVWASTFGNGLNHVDPETGEITVYKNIPGDATSLSHNLTSAVFEGSDGTIWVGTWTGLSRLDRERGTFSHYFQATSNTPPGDRLAPNTVTAIREDADDPRILWLATGSGFVRLDTRNGRHESFIPEGSDEDFMELEGDPADPRVLWATTDGGGLVRFDTRTSSFTVFRHDPTDPTSVNHDALFSLFADRSGMMWVGAQSQAGLSKFNPAAGGFVNYRHRPGDPSSPAPGNVWRVYIAPSEPNVIWSVHQANPERSRDMLTRIDQNTGKSEIYGHDANNPRSLGLGLVTSIREDRLGQLWFATSAGGLNLFDRKSRTFKRFLHDPQNTQSIGSNNLSGIFEDSEGILWIGTFNGGLQRMDPRTPGKFERFTFESDKPGAGNGKFVGGKGIAEDRKGNLWIGSNTGLVRLNTTTREIRRYEADADDPGALYTNNFLSVYGDLNGDIWAVTNSADGQVLHRFDAATESFTRLKHDPADPNSPSDTRFEVIHERPTEPGILWIGSPAGGLSRLDSNTGTFKHYLESDGLANNFVYGIVNDDNGNLWLSTNNGLSRFNPETETFRNFNEDDGLLSREFNSNAFFRSATGQLVFGSIAGVTAFYPSLMQPNMVPPEVMLTDFRLFNKSVSPGEESVLKQPIGQTGEIKLAHWQKTITFEFVGLHFKNPDGNQYAYMLEGFDEDWIPAGSQRTATYTNLDPKRYVFRVKAANSDGIWNEEGASVVLIIAPPFWQTWWFRILAVLAVLGLAAAVYRARVRQIQSRNRELELQVSQRTVELSSKNEQLEKSHAIIAAINTETEFESLLTAVLEQTRVIPGVEKASALVYDEEMDAFSFKASLGWDLLQLGPIHLTPDEAHARYVERAEEVAEDIFLERDVAELPGSEMLRKLEAPASLLVVRIRSGEHVDGYLVFDNMHRRDAFDQQDLNLLIALREHIRSAFIKTRLLSDLQRSLEHLKTTQAQLVQSEKLASLGQLTAGIAHEIKNPLNFINNFAALCAELADEIEEEIRNRGAADDNLGAVLQDLRLNAAKIQEHGRRADGIVRSMLEHSRGKSGERQNVDVNGLLDEYVNLAFHGLRAQKSDFNVSIDRKFDASIGRMDVIPQELGRVFINLLNNAFYAVHERATSSNGTYEPRVSVSSRRLNDLVEIRIADNGPGIPARLRERIFEPFFTTKPTGEGTGLGLSLSYDIITKGHNGRLDLSSAEGEGTEFVITIPAAVGQVAVEAAAEPAHGALFGNGALLDSPDVEIGPGKTDEGESRNLTA